MYRKEYHLSKSFAVSNFFVAITLFFPILVRAQTPEEIKGMDKNGNWAYTVDRVEVDKKSQTLSIDLTYSRGLVDMFKQLSPGATAGGITYDHCASVLFNHARDIFENYPELNKIKVSAIANIVKEDEYGNLKDDKRIRLCSLTLSRRRSNRLNWDRIHLLWSGINFGGLGNGSVFSKYFDSVWHDPKTIDTWK
jgi:hypothetical protein